MKKERDYTNSTLVQADEVLQYMADAKAPVSMSEIVKGSGLKQDAVFRVLWNLDRLDWVQKIGDHYKLHMRLALFWARYKSSREAERDAIDRELKELEVEG